VPARAAAFTAARAGLHLIDLFCGNCAAWGISQPSETHQNSMNGRPVQAQLTRNAFVSKSPGMKRENGLLPLLRRRLLD